jgi:predicted RNase H-like HicB family nuclease
MVGNFTARYKKISSGYMGQIIEWPEVVTEGTTLEECREMLVDALNEMILAYGDLKKEIPVGHVLFEPISVEIQVPAAV